MKPKKAVRPTSRLRWCSTRSLRILVVINVSEEGCYGGSESLLIKASIAYVAAQGDDRLVVISLFEGNDALSSERSGNTTESVNAAVSRSVAQLSGLRWRSTQSASILILIFGQEQARHGRSQSHLNSISVTLVVTER